MPSFDTIHTTSFDDLSSCNGRQSNKTLVQTARNANRHVNHCINFVITAQTKITQQTSVLMLHHKHKCIEELALFILDKKLI